MKNKRTLCLCNTPLQLLNMIHVISSYYDNDSRDLVVTDEITNYEILVGNIRKSRFFENVFLVKEDYKATVKRRHSFFKPFALMQYAKRLKSQHDVHTKYDRIFFGGASTNWLNPFVAMQTKKNTGCEFIWIDEGTASYSTHGLYWKKNKLQRFLFLLKPSQIIKRILGANYLSSRIDIQYLYRPEMADYQVPFERKYILLLDGDSKKANLLKEIFGFDESNYIKEKYIYFAGAGDVDGLCGNEKELLALVAECVGKQNLLVKVHPRESVNYYIQNGYRINTNVSIPWEIYCLEKEQLKDKVLISIFSTAIVSPFVYFGLKTKVVSLMKMFDITSFPNYYRYLLNFIENNIFKKQTDIFLLPNNICELKKILNEREEQ